MPRLLGYRRRDDVAPVRIRVGRALNGRVVALGSARSEQDLFGVTCVQMLSDSLSRRGDRIGYAARCLERIDELMRTIHTVIKDCRCPDGCPSCVGSAIPPFAQTDLDSAVRGRIPSKDGARQLLDQLLDPSPPAPNPEDPPGE